jgi:hypothetical protein
MHSRIKSWRTEEKRTILQWSVRNQIKTNKIEDPMEWVLSLEEEERERHDMKFLSWLHIPCLFMAPDTWYGRMVQAHPARTRCSRLRTKAVDLVRPDGTDVSLVPIALDLQYPCQKFGVLLSKRYGRMIRSSLPVPMVAKVTDGFGENSNFSSSRLRMRYGRVVQADPAIPLVAKVTVTCELKKFYANFHVPLCINSPSKMTKENNNIYSQEYGTVGI